MCVLFAAFALQTEMIHEIKLYYDGINARVDLTLFDQSESK